MLCYRVVDKEFQEGFTPCSPVTKDTGKCWDVTIKSWWFEESHPKRMDLGQISTHTHSLLGVDQWANLNSWCVSEKNGFTRLMSSKANLLALGWHRGKYSVIFQGQAGRIDSWCSKDPNSLTTCRKEFLKAKWGRWLRGVWSAFGHPSYWLVVKQQVVFP